MAPIAVRVAGGTLCGKAKIGLAVGGVINRFKLKKHFVLEIDDTRLAYVRKNEQIATEAGVDGVYILRTSLKRKASRQRTDDGRVVHSFRSLLKELVLRSRNTARIGDTDATFVHLTNRHRFRNTPYGSRRNPRSHRRTRPKREFNLKTQ